MIGEIIDVTTFLDGSGALSVLECDQGLPFIVRRVYYIYGVEEGAVRGAHAHQSSEQIIVCVAGHCRVTLNNGFELQTVNLDTRDKALYINSCVWREIEFSTEDAILLVLADKKYSEKECIRDYDEFLHFVGVL